MVRVRVAALTIRDDRILLARHRKGGRTTFLLPGGGLENGEFAHDALVREMREEAGVTAQVGELRYIVEAYAPDASRHLVQLVFAVTFDGEVGASTDTRVVGCEWHPIADLARVALHPAIGAELARDLKAGSEEVRYLFAPWVV